MAGRAAWGRRATGSGARGPETTGWPEAGTGDTDSDQDFGRDLGPEADPESLARSIVLTKLTAQARTRQELSIALRKRNVPDDVSERVLDRMGEVGLVDDAAFADAWVSSRQSRRHLSRTALRHELARKGVDREQIDDALEQVGGDEEYSAALALAEKKARSGRGLDPAVRRRRLAGALARKGFGPEITRRAMAAVLEAGAEPDLDLP